MRKIINRCSAVVCMLSAGPTFALYIVCSEFVPVVVASVVCIGSAYVNVITKG